MNVQWRLSTVKTFQRTLSTTAKHCQAKKDPSLPNLEPRDRPTRRGLLRIKLFDRFFNYLRNYEAILQKLLPTIAFKAYKTFSDGSKSLFLDMKEFSAVYNALASSPDWQTAAKSLTRKQLELYLTLPPELRRVAPVLVVSALPFAQNVVFPVALMYPKLLLSSHFWSDQTKAEVREALITKRHSHYASVFKRLIALDRKSRIVPCRICIRQMINGSHPSTAEIMAMAPAFKSTERFSLRNLSTNHVRHLVKIHENVGFLPWLFPRFKIRLFSNMLLVLDKAILREGIDSLSEEELQRCCHARGLDVKTASKDQMTQYLTSWLEITKGLRPSEYSSLVLHLPLFLGYHNRVTRNKRKI